MVDGVAPRLGFSATSKHSNIDRVRFVEIIETAQYFGVDKAPQGSDNKRFVQTVMAGLKHSKNDKHLQDAVSNSMDALPNVNVPAACKKVPKREDSWFYKLIPFSGYFFSSQEKDTKSLLNLIAAKCTPTGVLGIALPNVSEAERGLFVTSSSRPDTVGTIVTQRDNDGMPIDQDTTVGEIKNDDKYTTNSAYGQEACYLMLLHYWYRVLLGIDVEKVFGFYLCGPRCNDNKSRKRGVDGKPLQAQYSVGLMELSAPTSIGQLNQLRVYSGRYSLTDDSGVRHLARFLSSNTWNKIRDEPRIQHPIPAYFIAPRGFETTVEAAENAQLWSLVRNGTSAMVFRCEGLVGVLNALESFEAQLRKELLRVWGNKLKKHNSERFYLKVVTSSTTGIMFKPAAVTDERRVRKLYRIYPVDAVNWKEKSYVVLMFEAGRPLAGTDSFTWNRFKKLYGDLWQETVAIERETDLCHGDIGEHNLLFDQTKSSLLFIDWDEAACTPAPRAPGEDDIEGKMKHPEIFRQKSESALYTGIQLALLYFRLKCKYCADRDHQRQEWNPDTASVITPAGLDVLDDYRKYMRLEPGAHAGYKPEITTAAQLLIATAKGELGLP